MNEFCVFLLFTYIKSDKDSCFVNWPIFIPVIPYGIKDKFLSSFKNVCVVRICTLYSLKFSSTTLHQKFSSVFNIMLLYD